ncbi:MAG: glycine cleavage system protein GcvH [Candidatus Sericytochromatia bacterium]|nr:glycine cleavage system protein GcvH [Candidatus Sericytochromatia bacterium]
MTLPANIRFIASHEYLYPINDAVAVGVSRYAVDQLGDVVYVELPPVGKHLNKGDSFGVIESVKAVSDIYAPISGEVVAVNEAAVTDPGLITEDPYEKGWLIRIKGDTSDLDAMDEKAYANFTGAL